MKQAKQRKCKHCGTLFTPRNSLHVACSLDCAMALGRERLEKKEAKEHKAKLRRMKENAKTLGQLAKEAQTEFNRYIRERDRDQPCISCGRHHEGQYHAGHYRSVGACPELRFEELNVHKQCAPCNNHKSGNVIEYRIRLVARIGIENVEWLEGPHDPKKYTREELRELKAEYRRKANELKKQREAAQ